MSLWCSKIIISSIILSVTACIIMLILAFVIVPQQFNDSIAKNFGLIDGNFQYNEFMGLLQLQYRIYFFNITNKDEIMNGAKPIVDEIGPYIYREIRQKIKLDSDSDTITFKEWQRFYFDPIASYPLTQQDSLTALNFPLLLSLLEAENEGRADTLLNCLSNHEDLLFITMPVGELIFTNVTFSENPKTTNCSVIIEEYRKKIEESRYIEKFDDNSFTFSYFNYKTSVNNTLTVDRGINDRRFIGKIISWNGKNYSEFWDKQTKCSQIQGTDSTLFPPEVHTDKRLYLFSTDIGRSFCIDYTGPTTYKEIYAVVFRLLPGSFHPFSKDSEDCFCTKLTPNQYNEKECYSKGILDFKSRTGAPVILSFPHFLWADKEYQNSVDGISPKDHLHKTYFIIEPHTGITLESVRRFQLNAILRPISGVADFANLQRLVLPLLWTEESFSANDKITDQLKNVYFRQVYIRDAVKYSLVACAIFIAVVFILVLKSKLKKE